MKLWVVRRTNRVTYDEYDAFVVRAADQDDARREAGLAATNGHVDEWNQGTWLDFYDPANAICEELTADGAPGVILGSFNAG